MAPRLSRCSTPRPSSIGPPCWAPQAACQSSQMVSTVCCARAVATVMSASSACVVAYLWLRRRIQPCPPSQQRQRGAGHPCERPEASLCADTHPPARLDYPIGLGMGRIRKSPSMIGDFAACCLYRKYLATKCSIYRAESSGIPNGFQLVEFLAGLGLTGWVRSVCYHVSLTFETGYGLLWNGTPGASEVGATSTV